MNEIGVLMAFSIIIITFCTLSRTDMQNYLIEQYGIYVAQILYALLLCPIVNLVVVPVLLVHIDKK